MLIIEEYKTADMWHIAACRVFRKVQ